MHVSQFLIFASLIVFGLKALALDEFKPVSKNVFRSAQPQESDYQLLRNFNVGTIINLRNDNTVEESKTHALTNGFEFYNLALDSKSTEADYSRALTHFFNIIDEKADSGKSILVHCVRGKDRTGLLVALYRVLREHKSPQEAFNEWRESGLSDEWGLGIQDYFWNTVGTLEARIIADPLSYYKWASQRLQKDGANASFPEFEAAYNRIIDDLKADWFLEVVNKSPELQQKLEQVKGKLFHVNVEFSFEDKSKYPYEQPYKGKFPYRPTIDAFEEAMSLFDIVDRIRNRNKVEPLYHFDRYLYHRHRMMANDKVVIVPTFTSLGFNPLIKVRSVPIGFIGLATQGLRVDRHYQTPLDFWYHDLNHVRRMVEYLFLVLRQNSIKTFDEELAMYQRMDHFIQFTLMPNIEKISLNADRDRYAKRAMLRVLIFEILHESALPPTREAVLDDLMRPPGIPQPFEVQLDEVPDGIFDNEQLRTATGNLDSGARKTGFKKGKATNIHFIHDRALSLLANVYNKLLHGFFDDPEDPKNYVVPKDYRTPETILEAAKKLFEILNFDNYPDDDVLLGWITAKEGSPEKFKYKSILGDLNKKNKNDKRVRPKTITDPLTVTQAVDFVREIKGNKEVVTFMGFAAFGYQEPNIIDNIIIQRLKILDPNKHIINSGSTKEGIGRVYELAKMMGFETTGLVSSRALNVTGQFSDYLDYQILIDSDEWGGKEEGSGKLLPVSEAFVMSSDRIIAIGGNDFTAVVIEAAEERGIPVEYHQVEMNYDASRRESLYRRKDKGSNYFGSALNIWRKIAAKRVAQERANLCETLLNSNEK